MDHSATSPASRPDAQATPADHALDLLQRLERTVVETVREQVDDEQLCATLIVELVASMEAAARQESF